MSLVSKFKLAARKSGSRFRAVFSQSSTPCPCGAEGDPYVYQEWHGANPEAPDCGGSGKLIVERTEEFYGFIIPVQDTEKEETVAGENTTERRVLHWPGDTVLDDTIRIEKLNKAGEVVATFTGADFDEYEVGQEIISRFCTLTEVAVGG